MEEFNLLRALVEEQNRTIHILEARLKSSNGQLQGDTLATSLVNLEQKNAKGNIASAKSITEASVSSSSSSSSYLNKPPSPYNGIDQKYKLDLEKDCENRYGLELVNKWRNKKQTWCKSATEELTCYPYHQVHKQKDGRGLDLICEATNFIIDFSKISGNPSDGHVKPHKGSEYLQFAPGSLLSDCTKTEHYKDRLFMSHHSRQMRTFQSGHSAAPTKEDATEEAPTYLLARDEDCENSFHSTADFMNMLLVDKVLDVDTSTQQVVLFDKFSNGPYIELIQKAYSPNNPVKRHTHYAGKKVRFKKLIFHLESNAGLIFPKVANPDPLRCYGASLFDAYRRFILNAFNLLHVQPPVVPQVTLTLRHRAQHKNVGRVMSNEQEVVEVLKRGNMMDLKVVDTATMSLTEQLTLIRATNVLVGVHGAGLMYIMFAAEEAVLVEIHPSYRQDRHFRHAARMTGKIYMPVRATKRESCQGTSDSVTVPILDFIAAMDGALRIARNFDDGISECGLNCPKEILAIDKRLDSQYKRLGMKKANSLVLAFPC